MLVSIALYIIPINHILESSISFGYKSSNYGVTLIHHKMLENME